MAEVMRCPMLNMMGKAMKPQKAEMPKARRCSRFGRAIRKASASGAARSPPSTVRAMPTTTGSISRAASLVKTEEAPHTTTTANATTTGSQPVPRCAVIDSLPNPAAFAYPNRAMTAMAGWQPRLAGAPVRTWQPLTAAARW